MVRQPDNFPTIDAPKQLPAGAGDVLGFRTRPAAAELIIPRPVPAWHVSRRQECSDDTLAVLALARQLLLEKERWCQRSFARGWLDIPVPTQSGLARRYCMLGAVMRAGRELGFSINEAQHALEWLTVIPVAYSLGRFAFTAAPELSVPEGEGADYG
jgi:hypothetical protein